MRRHHITRSALKTKNIIFKAKSKSIKQYTSKSSNTCYTYFMVKKRNSSSLKHDTLNKRNNINSTTINSTTTSSTSTASNSKSSSELFNLIPANTKYDKGIIIERPKRLRHDSQKQNDGKNTPLLCIEDVQMIVTAQENYDGGVNCHVCGKLYKSRVCFIKHIWEHTVYWNMFEGSKNHERVLSIQAAIILCCGIDRRLNRTVDTDICSLLVTSPHTSEAKHERDNCVAHSNGLHGNHYPFSTPEHFVERQAGMNSENKHFSHDNQHTSNSTECNYHPWKYTPFTQPSVSPSLSLQSYPYPVASSEILPPHVFKTVSSQQFSSPNIWQDYRHTQTSAENLTPLESNEISFVSPLKRKRED